MMVHVRWSHFWIFDDYTVRLFDKVEIEFVSGRKVRVDLIEPGVTGLLLYDC